MNRRRRAKPSRQISILKKWRLPSEWNHRRSTSPRLELEDESTQTRQRRPGSILTKAASSNIAPLDPPVVEVESNLGENEVVLGRETDAISSDHERLGTVSAFELGDMGLVEAITVSEGLIFKERSTFPLSEIGEFGTNAVHLRLTRSAAEDADRRPECAGRSETTDRGCSWKLARSGATLAVGNARRTVRRASFG